VYAAAVNFDATLLGLLIECGSEPGRCNRRLARTGNQFLTLPIRKYRSATPTSHVNCSGTIPEGCAPIPGSPLTSRVNTGIVETLMTKLFSGRLPPPIAVRLTFGGREGTNGGAGGRGRHR
jgi:hypothetical protein